MKNITIIDRRQESVRKLESSLRDRGYRVRFYKDERRALHGIGEESPDLVISELALRNMSGPRILREIKRIDSAIPVIIITEHSNTQDAIDSMREGAYDYFAKPLDTEKTLAAIEKALHATLPDEEGEEDERGAEIRAGEGNLLIGRSAEMVEIYKRIGQVAASDAAVLIQGESGTGKELVARAIHENSRRRNGPFLAVNCAAIPETLLESELFGYERGAFTGALSRKMGKFEQASGGTIFLDEIGDMSMPIQSKVLRVLQEQAFTRIGGRETVRTDTRVVAATNKSLVSCMKDGTFRVDLFYRLKVVSIFLPPLRERGEDIFILAEYFLREYASRSNKRVRSISRTAADLLREYDWPGNVRELENAVQTGVLLNKTGVLAPEDLPIGNERTGGIRPDGSASAENLCDSFRRVMEPVFGALSAENRGTLYDRTVSEFERALIGLAMERVGGNQVKAARLLGISRNTLRNRIDRFRTGRWAKEGRSI